jgi:hypothetical protein
MEESKVCRECEGSQVVTEMIPGHTDECLVKGSCSEDCPVPYPVEVPCPTCSKETDLNDPDYIASLAFLDL